MTARLVRPAIVATVLVLHCAFAQAQETGVDESTVRFGQSAAFSGPAEDLGIEMRRGIEAAFREANADGGVRGRMLELVALDDAYEPEAAIANTERLIDQERVFALIGAVGTPTSRSAVPLAAARGVPYVAPFTGAAFLRDPALGNVVNLRASYYQETEKIVDFLTGVLGIDRIGVFYQDDSFGQAGLNGVRIALEKRGLAMVGRGVYPRNTKAVKTGLLDLRSADPDAVVMVGAYQPVASFVAWAHKIGFRPLFMTISFVGSNALIEELGADSEGIFVTQVVPPLDQHGPVAVTDAALEPAHSSGGTADGPRVLDDYRGALEAHSPGVEAGFVSLEGYLAGRLAIDVLDRCGADPDRACFLDAMASGDIIDLGGFEIRFGNDNQGSDAVFLTVIDAGGNYRRVLEDAVAGKEN